MDFGIDVYNRPSVCSNCGGKMMFVGVGEYHCEKCKRKEYDDYGKVRNYIEEHKGATAAQIEAAIGVKQNAIRQMLREARLEVTADSKSFLKCEICGVNIRSGSVCPKCEVIYQKKIAENKQRSKTFKGTGMKEESAEGEKRFKRDK